MKQILLLLCLISTISGTGQKILFPYRVGNKFGLSDDKGKIVLKPQYVSIDYITRDFFSAELPDSNADENTFVNRRNQYQHNLLKGSKTIVEKAQYPHFFIFDNLIANSRNEYHAEDCTLYNFKGEVLLKEKIAGAYVNDDRDVGYLAESSEKYSFISLFQFNENSKKVFSIALYDKTSQKIVSWLVQKVLNYKLTDKGATYTEVTYIDEYGSNVKKYIGYKNGTYTMSDVNEFDKLPVSRKANYEGKMTNYDSYPAAEIEYPRREPELSLNAVLSDEELEKRGLITYELKNDSLFYRKANQKIFVKPNGSKYILINSKSSQKQPVIFKKGNKYGLVVSGVNAETVYDSLVYFGRNYIAGKKVNNKLKFGILNIKGAEVSPFVYDSLSVSTTYKVANKNDKRYLTFLNIEKPYINEKNPYVKNKNSSFMKVFSEGKTGLIDQNGTTIIPLEFEMISQNDIMFISPKRNNFTLLKNKGKYGTTFIQYNNVTRKNEMKNTTPITFTQVPCFYIDDYYGIKNYKMYGLFTTDFKFVGYASQNGTNYFKD